MTRKSQPMQPIIIDEHGTPRFQRNAIVRHLLDHGGIDMNKIALHHPHFDDADHEQFAQLIGCSTSGFGDMSYASKEVVSMADRIADALLHPKTADLAVEPGHYFAIVAHDQTGQGLSWEFFNATLEKLGPILENIGFKWCTAFGSPRVPVTYEDPPIQSDRTAMEAIVKLQELGYSADEVSAAMRKAEDDT